ncbi:MAG: hypothetical protein IJA69_04665 [Clostridia bacterium]|nr:hypothetical protein [Clostridia bacterium]
MKKILLYLSAFIPLYFLIIVKILIDIINHNLSFNVLNTLTLIVLSILIALGAFGAYKAIKHEATPSTKIEIIQKTSITEQYFLGYFSLFVLFALSFELERVSMFVVFVLIIILIGVVYIKNDLFYINPFLNILGYNFYTIIFINLDNNKGEEQAKFFCKGKLDPQKNYHIAKLSHQNFSMIVN